MVLGEQQQEVGQLRVGQGVAVGQVEVAQLAAGGEHQTEGADLVLAIRERRARGPRRRWPPDLQEVAPPFPELTRQVKVEGCRPAQRAVDPAVDLLGSQHATLRQRRHRSSLDDEADHDVEDLPKARRLVRNVRARAEGDPSAAGQAQFLDDEGMREVASRTAAPAVTPERPQNRSDEGANHPEPGGMILGG